MHQQEPETEPEPEQAQRASEGGERRGRRREWCDDERDMSWLRLSSESPPEARGDRGDGGRGGGLGRICRDIIDDLDPARRAAAAAAYTLPYMDPTFDDPAAFYARRDAMAVSWLPESQPPGWRPPAEDDDAEPTPSGGGDDEAAEEQATPPMAVVTVHAAGKAGVAVTAEQATLPRKLRWQAYL